MAIQFIKSAVHPEDWPEASLPEVVFAGRSNAGKSSLINSLYGAQIAKVSGKPGKTRLLNFFSVNERYHLVDTPGYGYAAVSGDEVRAWQSMLETYFSLRGTIVGMVLVADIRRKWSDDEAALCEFMASLGRPVVAAFTKADKLKSNELKKAFQVKKQIVGPEKVMAISSTKKKGTMELEEYIFKQWVLNSKGGSQ
ncbi:MAG: ribosome biogenesis GTP-binding protein YihA/YsxC [Pseudomonadota bacterium]